jgi:hypothetical protein
MEKRGKEAIITLLKVLNAKYVNELRNDPTKEAVFMKSKFSDVS